MSRTRIFRYKTLEPLIAIDVTSYLASQTGVGVYIAGLVRALLDALAGQEDSRIRLCAVSRRRDAAARLATTFGVPEDSVRQVRLPVRIAAPLIDYVPLVGVVELFGKAGVFHAGPLFVPRSRGVSIAVTVLDLTPVRFPEYHLASNLFTLDQLRRRLRRAQAVIVPSASTAEDIENFKAAPREKISVIPLGVNPIFRPVAESQPEELCRLGLDREYILAVGSIEPRKNLRRLIEAFCLLKERHRVPHKLVVVGPEGWMQDNLRRHTQNSHLTAGEIIFTGFVPDETLNILYNRASLLAYPSLYEGFGFPPLEAMAAGCPVAVSRVSSIPEIVGDAGIYFDPMDVEDMARSLLRIIESPELRAALVKLGRKRSSGFSWQNTAAATLSLYRELCGMSQ